MQVVLLERIEKLGQMGDVVNVKNGYARNFLLPQGKALRATNENMQRFESQRAELEARNLERRKEAEAAGAKMEGTQVVLVRQAAESGHLYGSVSARDVALALADDGVKVERGQIVLDRPIKELGIHDVRISLHPEVYVTVTVNVARSAAEAEQQANGQAPGEEQLEEFFEHPEDAHEAAEAEAESQEDEENPLA